jgi:serine/threonine protein kinase
MSLEPGTRLGMYEVVGPLGVGGMGEVYAARDSRLGRSVAVKIVREDLADADRVLRLEREAKVLASLNHPHIAALYGLEEIEGRHFLVTKAHGLGLRAYGLVRACTLSRQARVWLALSPKP